MTLGTILKSVLGSSTSRYYDQPTGNKFFSEKNGGDYYHVGHYHHSHKTKGKSKADKKHGVLSALSLLAFLFFLNILQNCIREQYPTETGPVMMLSQGKSPMTTEEYKTVEKRFGRSVDSSAAEEDEIDDNNRRKSRTLLQVITNRQQKFIQHLKNTANWTNELTPVSDKDLEDQKLKTLNFPLYWKNSKLGSEGGDSDLKKNKTETRHVNPSILRRIKKGERLSTTNTTATTTAEDTTNNKTIEISKATANITGHLKNFPGNIQPAKLVAPKLDLHDSETHSGLKSMNSIRVETGTPQYLTPNPEVYAATTPRIRRSEYGGTNRLNGYGQLQTEETVVTPTTTNVGLNLDTYQTYPMYRYNNHRPIPPRENHTVAVDYPQVVTPSDIGTSYTDLTRGTTETTSYYSQPVSPHPKVPHHGNLKYRNKPFISYKGVFQKKNDYPGRNKPFRKVGNYNYRDHHIDTYYPIVVAARDPDDDSGLDLINMAWNVVTSLAKPLSRLVPSFGKDSQDDSQCYDLLVCEAQRASKYIGPTAEAVAATFGTMITWAVTEETRQLIVDAIKSGKENTCRQQIKDCEDRSGGKSTMTMIAQLLELKHR